MKIKISKLHKPWWIGNWQDCDLYFRLVCFLNHLCSFSTHCLFWLCVQFVSYFTACFFVLFGFWIFSNCHRWFKYIQTVIRNSNIFDLLLFLLFLCQYTYTHINYSVALFFFNSTDFTIHQSRIFPTAHVTHSVICSLK
jgi:hypothetical protein